ncbi:hypothetical protein C2E23DRAFT_882766 [Lenzites betulinus]|nr:hypothetical protein C2E23DRAFT_882766 [Lenzites betulinus]
MSASTVKLGKLLATPPVTIEILPGDGSEWFAEGMPAEGSRHAPFLFVEGNLGVPKKIAYKAYLDSIPTFRRCRERLRSTFAAMHGSSSRPKAVADADAADTLESTSILLLVNPAHQSALNARKRLVQDGTRDAMDELRFVSALVTLHEGAKQSILWHHRRWLLRRIYPASNSPCFQRMKSNSDTTDDGGNSLQGLVLDADAFRTELSVAAQACELYPRNYHAWAHRYLCVDALAALLRGGTGRPDPAPGLMAVWEEEEVHIRGWIERHVSDYSAMQYSCRVEVLVYGLREGNLVTAGTMEGTLAGGRENACEHAWSLVQVYPSHESLWLYLRGALSLPFQQDAPCPDAWVSDGSKRVMEDSCAFARKLLVDKKVEGNASVPPSEHIASQLLSRNASQFLSFQSRKNVYLETL